MRDFPRSWPRQILPTCLDIRSLTDRDLPERSLIRGVLERELFKRLWVVSSDTEPQAWRSITNYWDRLDREGRHALGHKFEQSIARRMGKGAVSVTALEADDAKDMAHEKTLARVPWLLVDIPGGRPGSDVPLYYVVEGQRRQLRRDDRAVGEHRESAVWQSYARDLRTAAGKIRVFCDPTLVDAVEASVPWEDGVRDLQVVLTELVP